MQVIDTIIEMSFGRPWWENLLKALLFIWLALVNFVAVKALPLALKDRKEMCYHTNDFVYWVGILSICTYAVLTAICVLAVFFFLMQMF